MKKNEDVQRIFVQQLADLIRLEDYEKDPMGKTVRLQIRCSDQGIEIMGDAARPHELEALLTQLDPVAIEQVLCG